MKRESRHLSKKHNIVIRFTLILILVLLAAPGIGSAQTREKVRVALGSISVSSSLFPIAQQVGIFPKYGIDMEPIYFGGGMNSIAAVTSNSVQFLAAGATATVGARLGGIDIMILSVQSNKFDYSVFVAPEVKTVQDLKGKIVTGTRPGASAAPSSPRPCSCAGSGPGTGTHPMRWGLQQRPGAL